MPLLIINNAIKSNRQYNTINFLHRYNTMNNAILITILEVVYKCRSKKTFKSCSRDNLYLA